MPVDHAYSQHGVSDHTFTGLNGVKCEEKQDMSARETILPETDREPAWSCFQYDVKEEEGGLDGDREEARHWVVSPGGVLMEVCAEPSSNVLEPVEDCSENIDGIQQSHTCPFGESNFGVIPVSFVCTIGIVASICIVAYLWNCFSLVHTIGIVASIGIVAFLWNCSSLVCAIGIVAPIGIVAYLWNCFSLVCAMGIVASIGSVTYLWNCCLNRHCCLLVELF